MNLANNRTIQTTIKAISVIVAIIVAAIGFIFFHADVKTIAALILFLLCFVLLPGNLIIRRFSLESEYTSSNYVRSFFAGFALNIIMYYMSAITGLDFLLWLAPIAMSVLWIVQIIKSEGVSDFTENTLAAINNAPASVFIFAFLVFLSSMFATQYSYISPQHAAYSYIKLDFAYHAGIINALSTGFPPRDPWVDNFTIYYHYYSEMLMSIPVRLFHLTSENILLMGTPYLITPVLSISLYAFFREFSGRNEFSGLYCLAFHFSNMLILKNASDSWFLYHIYSNINNTGLGVSCMLTALILLKTWDKESDSVQKRLNTKEMLFFAVLIMLMTGIKGPVSLVLVGGLIGTVILGLLLRASTKNQIAVSLLSAISFIFIYVFVLSSQDPNSSGGSVVEGGSVFNLGEVTDIFYLKDSITDYFSAHGLPHFIALLAVFAAFAVFFLSAFIVLFTIGYIREFWFTITKKKDFTFSRIAIYAAWMAGFLGVMILDFSGHSQVYFGFASCMLTPLISFWFLEDISDNKSIGAKGIRVAFAICMLIFSISSFMYVTACATESIDYYLNKDSENHEKYRSVSTAEYEGLLWLKNNTDKEDLIASDRFNSVAMDKYLVTKRNNNTHFAYAIYSQRRQYLEGSGFSFERESDIETRKEMLRNLLRLYDVNNKGRGDEARKLRVTYLVVSKRFNKLDSLENEDYKLCFTNKHMDIYKIKEAS